MESVQEEESKHITKYDSLQALVEQEVKEKWEVEQN
jgi:hypothetical protein